MNAIELKLTIASAVILLLLVLAIAVFTAARRRRAKTLRYQENLCLGDQFRLRAYNLSTSKGNWVLIMTAVEIAIVAFVIILLEDLSTSDMSHLILRIALIPSSIFAITYCAIQHNRDRRLEEEYEFKAIVSSEMIRMSKEYKEAATQLKEVPGGEQFALLMSQVASSVFTNQVVSSSREKKAKQATAETPLLPATVITDIVSAILKKQSG